MSLLITILLISEVKIIKSSYEWLKLIVIAALKRFGEVKIDLVLLDLLGSLVLGEFPGEERLLVWFVT